MSKFTESVERELEGLEHVSVGIIEGCDECPEYDEGHFSWSACEGCGSTLGGDRYAAHGVLTQGRKKQVIVHFEVCTDCLMYLANGEEPETWRKYPDED